MGNTRAGLDFDDVSIDEFSKKKRKKRGEVSQEELTKVAEESGFPSREPTTQSKLVKKKPRKRSPYNFQLNIKTRDGMEDVFIEAFEEIDITTKQEGFEEAVRCLLEKHKLKDLMVKYNKIIKNS